MPFLSISLLQLAKSSPLHLSAEIKVQNSINFETCKQIYKLCHINQIVQSTTWKGTCIKFKKYADCRFWANIYKIYWNFHSARIALLEKTVVKYWKPSQWLSMIVQMCLVLTYILVDIFAKSTKAERCSDVMFKLTLYCLSFTAEDLNL